MSSRNRGEFNKVSPSIDCFEEIRKYMSVLGILYNDKVHSVLEIGAGIVFR